MKRRTVFLNLACSAVVARQTMAVQPDPGTIFDPDTWYHARGLCVHDWYPLNDVRDNEQCKVVSRIIVANGWIGTWSITLCEGLVPDERHDYRNSGKVAHFQYRARGDGPDFTVIHRRSLNDAEAANIRILFKHIPFGDDSPWNDFDSPKKGGADRTVYVFERLDEESYSLWCRENHDNVPEAVVREVHAALAFARELFHDGLAGLPKGMRP